MKTKNKLSRRHILATSAATTAAFNLIPAHVLGKDENGMAPSDKLNIGFVGAGGRASASINNCSHHNIYALSDVDSNRAGGNFKKHSSAKKYSDWREMLDKEGKHLDAVVVATPDHSHAIATMAAMKLGLAVYCEKPLTRTVSEARALTEYARKNKIVTQMGNQGHSNDQARMAVEWIQTGVLGKIREVHCWTNRPIWPQGIVRPAAESVPSTMNWDVWLGPAPKATYSSKIAPFKWRGYWDYGSGALGDMGAHIMDHPIWALDLGAPLSVEIEFDRKTAASAKDTFPVSTIVTYKFAARGKLPPVTLKWYDGKNRPPWPKDLEKTRTLPAGGGIIYYGSKHNMLQAVYGSSPRIFPEPEMQATVKSGAFPAKTYVKSPGHWEEWLRAVKAKKYNGAMSNFDCAGPLTETMLLGAVAARVGSGTKLTWDSPNMKTNNDIANRYIHHDYRKGWSL